jgi:glutamate racemase
MNVKVGQSMKSVSLKTENAIGVFDSGLGGLTVMKALMRVLPTEHIVYLGDTARVPYGTKSKEAIIRFSKENVTELLKHNVKIIVVACNSSASHALDILQKEFPLPVIGVIGPGVRKAVSLTKNKKIGVIATQATINSSAYNDKIQESAAGIRVTSQACPLFVPLVEEGWFNGPVTKSVAETYLKNIQKAGVDTLILGCTHYPLLKTVLTKVLGRTVKLIDSAQEVSREVKRVLEEANLTRRGKSQPSYKFLVSDQPQHFQRLAKRFLGYNIHHVERIY